MTSHRNENDKKILLQTRVSECIEEEIREYSEEILGEENTSWAVRNILKQWANQSDALSDHSS